MRSKEISIVWQHFSKTLEKLKCSYCPKEYSLNTSTTVLMKHIQAQHEEKLEEKNEPSPKKKKITLSDEKSQKIHENLIKFIIDDNQSFMIVENEAFQEFVLSLNSNYILPGRTFIKDFILKSYIDKKIKVQDYFNQLEGRVSITTDLWTSCSNMPIIGITSHYFDKDWNYKKITLDFKEIPYPHDGKSIAYSIIETFKEFKIEEKLLGFTTDNASNMGTCKDELNRILFEKYSSINGIGCGAHIINLAVQKGLKKLENTIEKFREVNKTIKKSPRLFQEMEKIAEIQKVIFLTPKLDCVTRWNSTYLMLKDMLSMKQVYNTLSETKLDESDWNNLEDIVSLLKIYYQTTKLISGSNYPTIGLFFKAVQLCFSSSLKNIEENIMKDVSTEIYSVFEKYWSDFKLSPIIGAILDPRFKDEAIDLFPEVKNHFKNIYEIYLSKHKRKPIVQVIEDDLSILLESTSQPIDELTSYLKFKYPTSMSKLKFDIVAWWKLNQNEYPIISKMAKDFLSIQPSSVPSEQLFSESSLLITEKRANLHEDTIRACMCLKSWNKTLF
jgi:hypothetical protein